MPDLTESELRQLIVASCRNIEAKPLDDTVACISVAFADMKVVVPEQFRVVEKDLFSNEYYALSQADLDAVEELLKASWGLVRGSAPEILASLMALLVRLRRQRVRISEREGIILLTMKKHPLQWWREAELRIALPIAMEPSELQELLMRLEATKAGSTQCVACNSLREWKSLV